VKTCEELKKVFTGLRASISIRKSLFVKSEELFAIFSSPEQDIVDAFREKPFRQLSQAV